MKELKYLKKLFKKIVVQILVWEATLVLKKKKPFVIAVTGNLGKTSTKDAIYAVLKDHFYIRRSEKSMNSEFGIPLTILGYRSGWNNPFKWLWIIINGIFVPFSKYYPTHMVLEVGADRPGDIKDVSKWLIPDITVVTQFGEVPVHIEFFKDREEVIAEKGCLVEALKDNGVFIYNADDHDAEKLIPKTKARTVGIGINREAEIKAGGVKVYGDPIEGTRAEITVEGAKYDLVIPDVAGKSPVYCALPAIAVARELNVPINLAVDSLRGGLKPKGRMRILKGVNGSMIIDDTYNASPKATEHGLKTLGDIDCKGRKIAVLGDMLELGAHTRDEHYKIGMEAAKCSHLLFTVGIRARFIAEGALDAKMKDSAIMECDTSVLAGKELVNILKEGDVVYIKGSQSIRMERAVKMILAEEHEPKSVLVRQEKEWLQKS